jgi:hypothetical protein
VTRDGVDEPDVWVISSALECVLAGQKDKVDELGQLAEHSERTLAAITGPVGFAFKIKLNLVDGRQKNGRVKN